MSEKKMPRKKNQAKNSLTNYIPWSLQGEASDLKEQTICGD